MSTLETGPQSNSASALTRGANDTIAWLFAFVRWNTCQRRGQRVGWGSYLAIIENKAETSGDRLERTESVCRFVHPAEH